LLADLNMLVLLPGRERTAQQFRQLLEAAGLRLDRIIETASTLQIIEASGAVARPVPGIEPQSAV
jgi:hypothetical protein